MITWVQVTCDAPCLPFLRSVNRLSFFSACQQAPRPQVTSGWATFGLDPKTQLQIRTSVLYNTKGAPTLNRRRGGVY